METRRDRNRKKQGQQDWDRRMRDAAASGVARAVGIGPAAYDRLRDLPKLIRLDISAALGLAAIDPALIIARLEAALRAERRKARSGHWTYDLNRHIALRQAWLAEFAAGRAEKKRRGGARAAARRVV